MLMVVFGAGASYDSIPSRPPPRQRIAGVLGDPISGYRLPLAKELFEDRPLFNDWLARFEHCQGVIVRLRNACKAGSLEHELQKMQDEAKNNPWRHKQLAAVQFYLQSMLWDCKRELDNDSTTTSTNYKELLVQIEDSRIQKNEKICLVTFNYDTMLEDALPLVGVEINDLHDYVGNENYKIIKLHGSVNWAHRVAAPIEEFPDTGDLGVANEVIERRAELNILPEFRIIHRPLGGNLALGYPPLEEPLFPALAIPVENKREYEYECPEDHLKALRDFIPEVSKMLLIGWRGTETAFLQSLKENLRKMVYVMAVNGELAAAKEANDRLCNAGVQGRFEGLEVGFSQFVASREVERLLKI